MEKKKKKKVFWAKHLVNWHHVNNKHDQIIESAWVYLYKLYHKCWINSYNCSQSVWEDIQLHNNPLDLCYNGDIGFKI